MKTYKMYYRGTYAGAVDHHDDCCGRIRPCHYDDMSVYPTDATRFIKSGRMNVGERVKINNDWSIERES